MTFKGINEVVRNREIAPKTQITDMKKRLKIEKSNASLHFLRRNTTSTFISLSKCGHITFEVLYTPRLSCTVEYFLHTF